MEDKDEVLDVPEDMIVMDLASIPNGLTVEKVLHLMTTKGVLLYDSFKGPAPFMLNDRKKMKFMLKDVSKTNGKQK
jgi:hypothetical protein